jgi:AraC family transcriptional regulator
MQFWGSVLANANQEIHNACPCRETAGTVLSRRALTVCNVLESTYPAGLTLPRHMHSRAYFSFVLEGSYTESYGGGSDQCGAGIVRFLAAGTAHSNSYPDGARCLLIEVDPDCMARVNGHGRAIERSGELSSPKAAWIARRLYSEFRERDSVSSLAMEGLVLELIAEQAREGGKRDGSRIAPRWLQRARDMIESRFLEALSLAEIAHEAGVHPVHLSREFHRYYDCTVSDFIRKLRIEHASRLLADTTTPLAEIALGCGFADQSHFSATFKREMGITPARFRLLNAR